MTTHTTTTNQSPRRHDGGRSSSGRPALFSGTTMLTRRVSTTTRLIALLLLVVAVVNPVCGFVVTSSRIYCNTRITPLRLSSSLEPPLSPRDDNRGDNDDNNNDVSVPNPPPPPQEELLVGSSYESSVDWDEEWKKVVQNQNKPFERPGKNYYKSEAEIAAIKAANQATKQVQNAASNLPSMPSFKSLQGDWKFWIGVLLAISFGASLLTATVPSQPTSISSPDSYFI